MNLADRIQRGRNAISKAKQQGLDTSEWESYLANLLASAGQEPADEQGRKPWMLWEWRRVSVPRWQEILDESIRSGNKNREEYARWMLRDILLDPDYREMAR